jgi:hypothetical protein
MIPVRLLAILLTVALTGPSVGALVCELACAAEHARVPAAGSCHEHGTPASSAALAPAHVCHDVSEPQPSIAAGSPQLDPRLVADVASPLGTFTSTLRSPVVTAPHVATHAPPPTPSNPLRI